MIRRSVSRPEGSYRPAPEVVALAIAILIYGTLGIWGLPDLSGGGSAVTPTASGTPPTPSPRTAENHPRRADVLAVIEIDDRLGRERQELQRLLEGANLRGSEVATVLRRVSGLVNLGIERASRLSLDPAFQVPGAQLELLYADAAASVDEALDAAIANDTPYREAAERLVDLFVDLPDIDAELTSILERTTATPPAPTGSSAPPPTASPTGAPSPTGGASPSTAPSPTAAPSTAVPSMSTIPQPSDGPDERLRDRGFERGLEGWRMTADLAGQVTTAADLPLAGVGLRSLRIDAATPLDASATVTLEQSGIRLVSGRRYVGQLVVRASTPHAVRLRVVGPHQEAHGLSLTDVGPTVVVATIEFTALVDDDAATFFIELPGPWSGSVWLDDASLLEQPPG